MNTSGVTLLELVVTIAIIITLASVAVPAYGDVLGVAKSGADEASILVLNDATTAYAMLNDIPLDEVFDDISGDTAKMQFLVDQQYLMQNVTPAQDGAEFQWDAANYEWTVSNGQEGADDEDSGSTGDTSGSEGDGSSSGDEGSGDGSDDEDDESGDESDDDNNGNCNSCKGQWRWSHEHGWQWYDENGNNTGESEDDSHYEVYGYGYDYSEGTKVWYNGDYYICTKDTDNIPGQHKDWQKVTDEWYEYNSYEAGDTIWYNGKQYQATKSSTGKNPEDKQSHWTCIG